MTTVRCPMRECRRSVDLDALPSWPEQPWPTPCLHFIAAWGEGRESMGLEVLYALEGNRELVIRNVRPPEFSAGDLATHRERVETAITTFAHVVDGVALFGDQHERDAVSRELAQILIGPDPMVSRLAAG